MTSRKSTGAAPRDGVRFVYLAPTDILVARVARKCLMHLCEALVGLGADVELISLRIRVMESQPTRTRSVWDVYGIRRPFNLTMVPTPFRQERMNHRRVRIVILFYRLVIYPLYALRACRRRDEQGRRPTRTVFYSRNYACAVGVLPLRRLLGNRARVILEVHVPPADRLKKRLLRMVDGVACQSQALQLVMVQSGLIREERSIGRHGGFSPALTKCARMSPEQARAALGWGSDERIACYTGKVFWRSEEVELIVRMAEQLADEGVRVIIVGGRADHVRLWQQEVTRRGAQNVSFVGFVAPADTVLYQIAASVLLLYYPSGLALNDYRSPGKLFEYLAAGTPAVVSDYLSIREVIRDGENGVLVPPDRPDLLAVAVKRVLDDPALADRLALQASEDAGAFTWEATAQATLQLADRLWTEGA